MEEKKNEKKKRWKNEMKTIKSVIETEKKYLNASG